jgi:hypothetical protein
MRTEVTGKWIFKKPVTRGRDEFNAAWAAALVEEVDFEYSGYVLGDYLDAQGTSQRRPNRGTGAVRGSPVDEQAVHSRHTFEERPAPFPAIEEQALHAFCQDEYGGDADSLYQAIQAAHEFYRRGLARLSETHVVMFVIR